MELLPDSVCMLCEQNTAVLSSECVSPYMKYIKTTFFDKNKRGLKEQIADAKSLCVLCTHKVVIAHKFKDTYEEAVKKRTSFKKSRTACFLCEAKSVDLILTDDNPNDLITKMKVFMTSSLYPRPYIQCATCFDCLFYLSIWFETNLNLQNKLNSDSILTKSAEGLPNRPNKALRKIQPGSSNHVRSTRTSIALKKDKENVTPPAENRTPRSTGRSLSDSGSPAGAPTRKLGRPATKVSSDSNARKKMKGGGVGMQRMAGTFHVFLNNELKHLKTIKQINNRARWPTDVANDKRMFQEIPYVLVARDGKQISEEKNVSVQMRRSRGRSKIIPDVNEIDGKSSKADEGGIRRSGRLNRSPDVIEISESDEGPENVQHEETEVRQAFRAKTKLKIKVHKKFAIHWGPKSARKRNGAASKQTHTCNICDEVFSELYKYKQHSLWHEKPEMPKVDVTRSHLPSHIKASEFNVSYAGSPSKSETALAESNIDKIVSKYVNESETFEDADFNNSNEIDDIIVNLNSPTDEEKSPADVESKTETADSKEQDRQDSENVPHDGAMTETADSAIASDKANDPTQETAIDDSENKIDEVAESCEKNKSDVEDLGAEVTGETDKDNCDSKTETETEDCTIEEKETSTESTAVHIESEEETMETVNENRCDVDDVIEVASTHSEHHSDSDRTSIDEKDEQVNSIQASPEEPADESDNEADSKIEKILAEMHGESGDLIEDTNNEDEEDSDDEHEVDSYEATNGNDDKVIDDENDERGSEDDNETSNNSDKKRKRIDSDDEDVEKDSNNVDANPKAKKVRFAMDYQSCKAVQDESVPDETEMTQECSNNSNEENIARASDDDNECVNE